MVGDSGVDVVVIDTASLRLGAAELRQVGAQQTAEDTA